MEAATLKPANSCNYK